VDISENKMLFGNIKERVKNEISRYPTTSVAVSPRSRRALQEKSLPRQGNWKP